MIPQFLRRDPEKRRARRLERAEDNLRDEVHRLDKWSFADTPTENKRRHESIYRLIRRVEELGGDVLDVLPYSYEYLAEEAMPDVFERRQGRDYHWRTYRIGDPEDDD